jgi:hypothetical protein
VTLTPTVTPTPTATPLCGATPRAGCRQVTVAEKSLLLLKNKTDNSKDKLVWRWVKGAATVLTDYGDPINSTDYAFCAYDATSNVPARVMNVVVPHGGTCAGGQPCWRATGTKGFKYKDSARTTGGIGKIILKVGPAGKAKVLVKGKGANLPVPSLPLDDDTHVTAQVVNSNGQCWTASFPAPPLLTSSESFKDKGN